MKTVQTANPATPESDARARAAIAALWVCSSNKSSQSMEIAINIASQALAVVEVCRGNPYPLTAAAIDAHELTDLRRTDIARRAVDNERAFQCHTLREIFGNPFHPVAVDPAWLTWNGGTVTKIAQHIHEDRAIEDLPVLADVLEEAGCTSTELLMHLRHPGLHVRGCWAVDLILGKS